MKKLALTQIDPGLLILEIVPTCSADISNIAVPGVAALGVGKTKLINARRQKT